MIEKKGIVEIPDNFRRIGPQTGPQEKFLATNADVAIYGGAAGGGKTFGMLMDFARHFGKSFVRGLFLRRTIPEITSPGGAWDNSHELYGEFPFATPNESSLSWDFGRGTNLKFDHLQHIGDLKRYQSAQLAVIYFDELTHFLRRMFFYMFSRNRSMSGVKPYIRAATNPVANHWIYLDFLRPGGYVGDDGFAIPEMSGVIKYFYQIGDKVIFGDDAGELQQRFPQQKEKPLSFTFIPSLVSDNKILLEKDPRYLARLESMSYVDRMRLKYGNWIVTEDAGRYFNKNSFKQIEKSKLPEDLYCIRYWDMAGTKPDSKTKVSDTQARTASVLLGLHSETGNFYIIDVTDELLLPKEVEDRVINLAKMDGTYVTTGLSQDPGQAGKFQVGYYRERLEYNSTTVWTARETGSKEARANPVAQKARQGFFHIVQGEFLDNFLSQAENFPTGRKDMIDALSGAFSFFVENNMVSLESYTEPANISRWHKQNQTEAEKEEQSVPNPLPSYNNRRSGVAKMRW